VPKNRSRDLIRVGDRDGWGTRYSGAGIYDVRTATGGHYDHVHVSFRE